MSSSKRTRALGVVAVLLASQLLTACIVVPVPVHRPRAVIVDQDPHYGSPPPPPRRGRY
jgi:hypothetical protein